MPRVFSLGLLAAVLLAGCVAAPATRDSALPVVTVYASPT
jgi:PBP1b-binding outer membrane lipoprotein LpoB